MSHSDRPGTDQVPNPALGANTIMGSLSRKGRGNQTDTIQKHLLYMSYKIFDNLRTAYLYSLISFHFLNQIMFQKGSRVVQRVSFEVTRTRFAAEICNLLII